MQVFGIVTTLAIVVAALLFLRPAPEASSSIPDTSELRHGSALATPRRSLFPLLCIAGFLCCTPMAMPPAHLVALAATWESHPAGALMLSVLLGSALISRQVWGWLTDRIGGLYTILAASTSQARNSSSRTRRRQVSASLDMENGFAHETPGSRPRVAGQSSQRRNSGAGGGWGRMLWAGCGLRTEWLANILRCA